jgi:hypothetical protein
MRHLDPETLARLADEPPLPPEAEHLDACAACREVRDEFRAQTRALGAWAEEVPPPHDAWQGLRGRLREEGLLRRRPAPRALVRIAAGVALFLTGAFVGSALPAPSGSTPTAAAQVEEALRTAESAYLEALTRYAELAGEGSARDPLSRLAALEGIVLTTRAALEQDPADPVINTYHLAAVGQREAMLRQIAAASDDPWF